MDLAGRGRADDVAALAPGFDQHLDSAARAGPARELGVPTDLRAAVEPVAATARALLQVAPLDALDQLAKPRVLGGGDQLGVGVGVLELQQLQTARHRSAHQPDPPARAVAAVPLLEVFRGGPLALVAL